MLRLNTLTARINTLLKIKMIFMNEYHHDNETVSQWFSLILQSIGEKQSSKTSHL